MVYWYDRAKKVEIELHAGREENSLFLWYAQNYLDVLFLLYEFKRQPYK